MRQEAAIRRIGLVFLVLTFLCSFSPSLSPPQPTVANSDNNMVSGGISSAADAKRICNQNVRNFADIMKHYGITCGDIGSAPTVTIKSTAHGGQLFSMGHHAYGQRNPTSGKPSAETPFNIPSAGTVYMRKLASFDTGPYSTYKALKVSSSVTGKTFWILYSCGNLVSIGVPNPVKPCKYDASLPSNKPPSALNPVNTIATCRLTANTVPPCKYDHSLPNNSPKCFPPCPL